MPPGSTATTRPAENLLDTAVLEGVELDAARGLAERWQKVDEIPSTSNAAACRWW
ncbi:magnesium-transporting ATPase MgtA [Klebsiella pneumoniae]|uniref:Magnesium-transporting ATPase MgtA n=1 Tax=Klebsiella pneumoniae TaxID=573 RepID=A0A377TPC0_KLEPN|nr:magnesium-transporting ATPase MgtA [Klebsiella pneumoniae]